MTEEFSINNEQMGKRIRELREKEGLTQQEFNERMNNPDYFQIEDPHENRSHAHEMPAEETESNEQTEENGQEM